ncbi:hypothetical protein AB4472_09190 [Vibrio lentus]
MISVIFRVSKEHEEDALPSRMTPSGSNVKLSTSIFPNSSHLNAVTLSVTLARLCPKVSFKLCCHTFFG